MESARRKANVEEVDKAAEWEDTVFDNMHVKTDTLFFKHITLNYK